ncbi:hypothetical protein BN2475_630026 [Paraburkholderia ribeironis]|uniref:Uncharacterized protein n=1 Tax=Paraburkholderia ribeironis TaxID=1247936 RepID=A0A1N7SFJ2_9BURK|nr:hypothetical protein BN2475_630026 [Paraburkholderia ribeironis]
MTPWGEVKASNLKRADEYCRQQGKQMLRSTCKRTAFAAGRRTRS